MSNNPLWRYEMELPNRDDFDNQESYDQAMNMWVHDQLYGYEEDKAAYEREFEHERSFFSVDIDDGLRLCSVCRQYECTAPATKCWRCREQEMIDGL